MINSIKTIIIHPLFQQMVRIASLTIWDSVYLPEGRIQVGKESAVQVAYDILMMSHRLERVQIYLNLADRLQQNNIVGRFHFYARYELQTVKECILKNEGSCELTESIQGLITQLNNNPTPINNIQLKNNQTPSPHLILVTDLYRDYDDWLTLLHLIISGTYQEITIVTSNEVAGECAQITQSFLPQFKALFQQLHGKELRIHVFQGLSAFDFAPFHPDLKANYLGIHYPEKAYSAHMRIDALGPENQVKHYQDLLSEMSSWQNHDIDILSIGKIADLDMVLLLAESCKLQLNKVTVLGCRPQSTSTNTNGLAYHLQSLPEQTMMLDSRYGKGSEFGIYKETFSKSQSNSAHPIELYLQELLYLLRALETNTSSSSLFSVTLEHLQKLHYSRGSTYDLFTLLAEKVPVTEQDICFVINAHEPEKASCYLGGLGNAEPGVVIKTVKVRYPDLDLLQTHFITYLRQLTKPLDNKIQEIHKMGFDLAKVHQDYPLINHYGTLNESAIERSKRTLTGMDEYKLIARSLLILDVLADNKLDDETAAKTIAGGFPESEFGFEALPKPQNMIPNVAYLRGILQKLPIQDVIQSYIMHDLGKCISFVTENGLASGTPKAAAHDEYLVNYLGKNTNLAHLFANPDLNLMVKILDLLGHNPLQLQATGPFASLKMVADIAIFIKDYSEEVEVKKIPLLVATRSAINTLLINKAKALGLDTSNLANLDTSKTYLQLPMEQQNQLAFLMWTGGLRIMSTGEQLQAFERVWKDANHQEIVNDMVKLLMSNLDGDEANGFVMLYNPTGLLHKTDANLGLKAFLGPQDKGGMGAKTEEVITVAFPFILDSCKNNNLVYTGTVGHNEFQAQQLVEIAANLLPHLAGLTKDKNVYPFIDFGTVSMNQNLQRQLGYHRIRKSASGLDQYGINANNAGKNGTGSAITNNTQEDNIQSAFL